MRFWSFISQQFIVLEEYHYIESQRTWIVFEQRQLSFGYKKRQGRE